MIGSENAKWYVIHTYSGYEALVKDGLEKMIENNNLTDTIFEIKIPTEETIEERANGKKKLVQRKLMPCYVFVKMNYHNDLWFQITSIRGVTGFVGPQGRPLPLTDDEVKRMRLEDKVEHIDIAEGDMVQIVSGPLASYMGEVLSLNVAKQKARVMVSMFGRETEAEFDLVELSKLGNTAE
ncbi:MAG: transcription termination/antitermination factor NusG [Clostridia bacterium]|nr:transcription termination/antitermination factor NusG [Clostridia bacterium]